MSKPARKPGIPTPPGRRSVRKAGPASPPAPPAPVDPDAVDRSEDVPAGSDVVAGIDRPDAPDAPDAPSRRPDLRESEETVSEPGRDGVEGVREAAPDAWTDADREAPDDGGSSRLDAP